MAALNETELVKLDWLILGLGNPGYSGSRHNAGFDVLDRLLRQNTENPQGASWKQSLSKGRKSPMQTALLRVAASDGLCTALLVKPQTYMNLSGKVLPVLHQKYSFVPQNCIVVLDNLDLEPGRLRLKFGGANSHNGLRSLCENGLKSGFWRLFVGIGHPEESVESYVLRKPNAEQARAHAAALDRAQQALMQILQGIAPQKLAEQVNRRVLHNKTPKNSGFPDP